MKVRVTFTGWASEELRRAIRHYYGEEGMATREEVRDWWKKQAHSVDDDILFDLSLHDAEAADAGSHP
jgi:hypothetical protein